MQSSDHAGSCLLCSRSFPSDHGLAVHIGRKHNRGATRRPALPMDVLRVWRRLRRLNRLIQAVRS